jgi:hypothetical protein
MPTATQTEWIFRQLQSGPISQLDALRGCGCLRLAARINDLRRDGHLIVTERSRLQNGKVIAIYHLRNQE